MASGLRTRAEEKRAYWAMILPAFVLYLLVMAFPIVLSVRALAEQLERRAAVRRHAVADHRVPAVRPARGAIPSSGWR